MAERKTYRTLESLKIKIVKAQEQRTFLKKCRSLGLIPRRFIIRNSFKGLVPQSWFDNLSKRIMKKQIDELYAKDANLEYRYRTERRKISGYVTDSQLKANEERINEKALNIRKKKERELNHKINKLSESSLFKEIIKYNKVDPDYVFYSKQTKLKRETVNLLSNHRNYTLGNTVNPVMNFLTDLEYQRIIAKQTSEQAEITSILENLNVDQMLRGEKANNRLMKKYREAKEDLMKNGLVVVKTDKSNQIAVISRDEYIRKTDQMIRQLFVKVNKDNCNTINKKLKELVNKTISNSKEKKSLVNNQAETPELFCFLKTHKQNVPMRPVITLKGGPLQKLDDFLQKILKIIIPIPQRTIKNSYELVDSLSIFNEVNKENFTMFSLDVKSMFPSIKKSYVRKIIYDLLQEKEIILREVFNQTAENVLQLLLFVLNNCEINFEGKTYRQEEGLGIGAATSPILANYAMGLVEDTVLDQFKDSCIYYKRYVDDILIFIQEGKEHVIKQITRSYKNCLDTLVLTEERETKNEIQFLDIRIKRRKEKLSWVCQQSDKKSKALLNYRSDHKKSIMKNIATNMLERAMKLSSPDWKSEAITKAGKRLLDNQYPKKLVLNLIKQLEPFEKRQRIKEAKKFLLIPYIKNYTRSLRPMNKRLRFVEKTGMKIAQIAQNKKKMKQKEELKNCVYRINLTCGRSYIGQTKRQLKIRMAEHNRNLEKGDNRSLLVRHIKECKCKINQVNPYEILEREENCLKRQIKESIHMKLNPNIVSEESIALKDDLIKVLELCCSKKWKQR